MRVLIVPGDAPLPLDFMRGVGSGTLLELNSSPETVTRPHPTYFVLKGSPRRPNQHRKNLDHHFGGLATDRRET